MPKIKYDTISPSYVPGSKRKAPPEEKYYDELPAGSGDD